MLRDVRASCTWMPIQCPRARQILVWPAAAARLAGACLLSSCRFGFVRRIECVPYAELSRTSALNPSDGRSGRTAAAVLGKRLGNNYRPLPVPSADSLSGIALRFCSAISNCTGQLHRLLRPIRFSNGSRDAVSVVRDIDAGGPGGVDPAPKVSFAPLLCRRRVCRCRRDAPWLRRRWPTRSSCSQPAGALV